LLLDAKTARPRNPQECRGQTCRTEGFHSADLIGDDFIRNRANMPIGQSMSAHPIRVRESPKSPRSPKKACTDVFVTITEKGIKNQEQEG